MVDQVRQHYDVEVEWRAFDLHPDVPPGGMEIPWDPQRRAAGRARFLRLASQFGLEAGERTHWYDSTPAHEAAEWARERGADDALRRAIFRAYFVEARNIGSPDVLSELAAGVGLDGGDLRAALAEGRYRVRVQEQYDEARTLGIYAVPTFIAEHYALVGAQPLEAFHRLMAIVGQPPRQHQGEP